MRAETLAALRSVAFDLLVIGGGVTGCGIARDAALRGLKVALVEKTDFAAGTSSKSSKLVHGGLRYLEQLELKLVFEGTHERSNLARLAPHLVKPLPFVFPAFARSSPGLFKLDVGLWLYDALCGFGSYKLHRTYRAKQTLKLEPQLRARGLTGAVVYYDCLTDDARLTLENAIDARALGAVVANHVRAVRLSRDAGGKICGAQVEDVEAPGAPFEVRALVVVNASGPWSDEVRKLADEPPVLKASKGVHLVVDAKRLPLRHAVVMLHPVDRRVMFAIPWGERTVLGTTDTFYEGSKDDVFTTREDADYVLAAANDYFPQAQLTRSEVLSSWAGLRPLIAPEGETANASAVSREHLITSHPGFVTIAGGKLTTYRLIAEEAVDLALEQLGKKVGATTGQRPLPGAQGASAEALEALKLKLENDGLSARIARHLVDAYGVQAPVLVARGNTDPRALELLDPELPYVFAEVDEAIDRGFARTLRDVLSRRVPLLLRGRDMGLSVAPRVAEKMGQRLSWSAARTADELTAYRAEVAAASRFKGEG